ncbi:ATP-binding protein [Algoriphagus antarcticus]|uniref:histidine kinase n=1 Tax=Algoriphagus antarcticus TaxID=238540 RepID=A0A3E0DYH8_9BACT|nr:ATP-binding protein [Algoriphagus antarcticus]REG91078.1 phospho-acceptor domain-containing protein [Algoriphagus antarcticus]
MKKKILIALFMLATCKSFCQQAYTDSLHHELANAGADSSRLKILSSLIEEYSNSQFDSAIYYAPDAFSLARKLSDKKREAWLFFRMSLSYAGLGNLAKAAEMDLKGLHLAEESNDLHLQANILNTLGKYHSEFKQFDRALDYLRRSFRLYEAAGSEEFSCLSLNFISDTYLESEQIDSAEYYNRQAFQKWNDSQIKNPTFIKMTMLRTRAAIEAQKKNYDAAIKDLHESLIEAGKTDLIEGNYLLAKVFLEINQADSAIVYARKSLLLAESIVQYNGMADAGNILATIYQRRDPQQAILYYQKVIAAHDSASSQMKTNVISNLVGFDEQQRQYEFETATTAYQNKVRQYALISGVAVLLLIAFILFRNNRQKQHLNWTLQQTLTNLRSTQAQLIQSEKMASLGELTAGIAHEIQNPLNFVNNFSEVSAELIDEMNEELGKGDIEEARAIGVDLKDNLSKITHHGKRADAIVKGMLEHSRKSTGEKVLTDINALADEYLRLSFHGMRAKDKSFKADFSTDFDPTLPKVNVVPQEIGRVLLNIINNAFQASAQEDLSGLGSDDKRNLEGLHPTVIVSTKNLGEKIEISVKDNGHGIPDSIKEKIFQPFFTTKPTGQGTGLGLSLSYDIVKAHGGKLEVISLDSQGAEFCIRLPI